MTGKVPKGVGPPARPKLGVNPSGSRSRENGKVTLSVATSVIPSTTTGPDVGAAPSDGVAIRSSGVEGRSDAVTTTAVVQAAAIATTATPARTKDLRPGRRRRGRGAVRASATSWRGDDVR